MSFHSKAWAWLVSQCPGSNLSYHLPVLSCWASICCIFCVSSCSLCWAWRAWAFASLLKLCWMLSFSSLQSRETDRNVIYTRTEPHHFPTDHGELNAVNCEAEDNNLCQTPCSPTLPPSQLPLPSHHPPPPPWPPARRRAKGPFMLCLIHAINQNRFKDTTSKNQEIVISEY